MVQVDHVDALSMEAFLVCLPRVEGLTKLLARLDAIRLEVVVVFEAFADLPPNGSEHDQRAQENGGPQDGDAPIKGCDVFWLMTHKR